MDKKEVLKKLINTFGDGSNKRFAEVLGINPNTISVWLARGTYDIELIYGKCVGVSAEYLITGEGEIMKSRRQADAAGYEAASVIIETQRELIETQRRLIEELESKK